MVDLDKPRKPLDTNFRQQRLTGWRFAPGPIPLAVFYLLFGCAFVIYGAIILKVTVDVVEVSKRYDDIAECKANWRFPSVCVIDIDLSYFMNSPVFLYYEIRGMYQNHRRYVKSRDVKQLLGHDRTTDDIEDYCEPIVEMGDLGLATTLDLRKSDPANPCGLIAKSFFNDTYKLYKPGGEEQVEIKERGIAWSNDISSKFERSDSWKHDQWIDVENEHFMVWMNIAGLPTFRKLWGRIDDDLHKGTYRLMIDNNYDVGGFSGEKWVVLTTTCWFGGKIEFMGIWFIIVGIIAVLGAALMFSTFHFKRRYGIA